MTDTAIPVTKNERIDVIDSLRGFAILGILLMNIPGFAYGPMGHNPSIANEYGTINYYIWKFVNWIPDGTQRALFSMLFGAGIILFIQNKEQQHNKIWPGDYFLRRQLWLIVFGLIDVYLLLWRGDILFDYGCYGLMMLVFRLWQPRKLLFAAGFCMICMLARENMDLYQDKLVIAKGEKVEKLDTITHKLTPQQNSDLNAMLEFKARGTHERQVKANERANRLMTGTYSEVYDFRVDQYLSTFVFFTYFSIWDVLLFMFIGMAFFKMGILTGKAPTRLYAIMCIIGLGLGIIVAYYQLQPMIDAKFNRFAYTKSISLSFYEVGRTLRALGIFGLLMLIYKSGVFNWFFRLMRPVGQMAFTNYLTQSIICGLIFYGMGFGLFGKLQRYEAYLVVMAIWLLQIVWSHVWLRYYQYGPMEWIWRQLTYWKKLPLRKAS